MNPLILITGFSVFPGAPVNPTSKLINWCKQADLSCYQADFKFHLFETSYRKVETDLRALSEKLSPAIILHFGLDAKAEGFKLEHLAHNALLQDRPDVDSVCPSATVCEEGASRLITSLPITAIEAGLRKRSLPVQHSNDAGGYLCNYLLYQTLNGRFWKKGPAYAGFIHVPHCEDDREIMADVNQSCDLVFMTKDTLMDGVSIIISECLKRWERGP